MNTKLRKTLERVAGAVIALNLNTAQQRTAYKVICILAKRS